MKVNYGSIDTESEIKLIPIESPKERRRRKISYWIIVFVQFLQAFELSALLAGVWPYFEKYSNQPSKEQLGWVIAISQIGNLTSNLLLGVIYNKIKSVKILFATLCVVSIFSQMWYSLLYLHEKSSFFTFLLVVKFFTGACTGTSTLGFIYIAKSTLLSERTFSYSYFTLGQSIAYILGPLFQAVVTPLGEDGFFLFNKIVISMFTAVGWLNCIFSIISLFIFIFFFEEYDLGDQEQEKIKMNNNNNNNQENPLLNSQDKKDYKIKKESFIKDFFNFPILCVLLMKFVVGIHAPFVEILATPVCLDQFAWNEERSISSSSLFFSINSIINTLIYASMDLICKRLSDIWTLIIFGLIPLVFGRIFFFPFSGEVAHERKYGCFNETQVFSYFFEECQNNSLNWEIVEYGCVSEQDWCFKYPALKPHFAAIGHFISNFGFSFAAVLIIIIFSKIIGTKLQSIKLSVLSIVGSLQRIISPIYISYFYTNFGLVTVNSITTLLISTSLICVFLLKTSASYSKLSTSSN